MSPISSPPHHVTSTTSTTSNPTRFAPSTNLPRVELHVRKVARLTYHDSLTTRVLPCFHFLTYSSILITLCTKFPHDYRVPKRVFVNVGVWISTVTLGYVGSFTSLEFFMYVLFIRLWYPSFYKTSFEIELSPFFVGKVEEIG
jgi:hypothetical protein